MNTNEATPIGAEHDAELVVEGVLPDLLHVVPVLVHAVLQRGA